jgi:hypothetical protein
MRKPALLIAALCSLALFFGWKARNAWLSAPPPVDDTGRASSDLWRPGVPVPDPSPPPDSSAAVSAIVARPLFRADRLPFREDAGAAAGRNYEAELSRLSLIGTLTFGGELKGIVVSKGSPRAERWEVKAGDPLPGFKVKEVTIDGLVVTADKREFQLPLYAGPPTTAGGGPVRTETPRKTPAPAQQAATAPPPTVAQPPSTAAPPPSTVAQPRPAPTFVPERSPVRPPRYYPRR